jgi:NitT/TauT family transport system permease protein
MSRPEEGIPMAATGAGVADPLGAVPPPSPARSNAPRMAGMSARTAAVTLPVLTALVIFSVWELLARTEVVDPVIVPPVTEIMKALYQVAQTAAFWEGARTTALETLIGFALGAFVGWALGTLVGLVRIAQYSLYPVAVAFQIMPRIALAPVFLTWFGFGITARIVMAATICFFALFINVVVALENVDKNALTLMRALGASRWETYWKLMLPSSLPMIFAGLKNAVTLALIGAIVGEFVGGSLGLGVLITQYNQLLEVSTMFALIFTLMIFGLILYGLIEIIDRRVVDWRGH